MRNEIAKLRAELMERAKTYVPDDEYERLAKEIWSLNAVELVTTLASFRQTDDFCVRVARNARRGESARKAKM